MRCIDADALVIMLGLKPDEWGTPDERWRPESEFGLRIINAPTIEPKRGKWIEEADGCVFCSECGIEWLSDSAKYYKYCPICGARMEEHDETD